MEQKLLLRVEEAAKLLGLSRSKTYMLAAEGELPTIRIGRRSTRVPLAALRQWVRQKASDASPTA